MTAELAAADGLWLGLYRTETGLPAWMAKGWDRCVAGDAPSFINWREGQPSYYSTTPYYQEYQQDCAYLQAGNGRWNTVPCEGSYGVNSDPFPCLCARGNASAAFTDDLKALEATARADNERLRIDEQVWQRWQEEEKRRTSIAYATAIAIALLPTLLLLGRAGWRRLVRCAAVRTQRLAQGFRAPQPRPHDQRRRRRLSRPRPLLGRAPRQSRECCTRRERRPPGGGCASALRWDRWAGRYRRPV